MNVIGPCLWLDGWAEEAAAFHVKGFPDGRVISMTRAAADNPSTRTGEVLFVSFGIRGQSFTALNRGPQFPFAEAVSLEIDCADRAEVDRYREALVEGGGEHGPCGWLKDRFGLSWQPAGLTGVRSATAAMAATATTVRTGMAALAALLGSTSSKRGTGSPSRS